MEVNDPNQIKNFSQDGIELPSKNLNDFFYIKGGVLNLRGILQTENFIAEKRGVRMRGEGLDSNGGTIQGADIGPANTLAVNEGGTGAATLTGILKGNGTSAFTAIAPLAGTKHYWVSDTSGGAVTRRLTFQDGILVSET